MWACFITVAAAGIPASSPLGVLLIYLGVFAPSLVALGLTARAEGRAGVRALLGRIVQGPVAARWYVFALAYIPAIKLAAAAIHRVATGAWPRFGDVPLYLIPLAILVSTPVQAGEEVGWRGYALPRMAERMGLAPASVLLGLLWAFWHLPQFFIREADTYGQSFLVYVLQVTALSVAMAWLFAKAGGSLLPVKVMHAAVNNAKDIVPSATPGASDPFGSSASLVAWLTVTLLWLCAGAFLARMPDVRFSNRTGSPSRRLA
jgi:membrane protease YdiL (CAAX protease family)